jgi:iron complex outermembrane receptor protein
MHHTMKSVVGKGLLVALVGVFAGYTHPSGAYLQATANTWGEYWTDNANSEMHEGYGLVTDLSLGYQTRRFELALILQNLFDPRYALARLALKF